MLPLSYIILNTVLFEIQYFKWHTIKLTILALFLCCKLDYIKHVPFREKILKGVKARDSYGQVLDTVQLAQAVKQQDARTQPDIPMIMENGNINRTIFHLCSIFFLAVHLDCKLGH